MCGSFKGLTVGCEKNKSDSNVIKFTVSRFITRQYSPGQLLLLVSNDCYSCGTADAERCC